MDLDSKDTAFSSSLNSFLLFKQMDPSSVCLAKCEAHLTEIVQKDVLQLKSLQEKLHEQQSRGDLCCLGKCCQIH
uniref:Uncharacterized protein n=1 Tax=Meleagris gallopavo TaxID=9103 RepID=A0A803XK27_MELGA